jgi:Catalytic LigB subunit of aromatic ring-opening dioxygenase
MATVCTVICTSHSPFLYASPEEWDVARAARGADGALAADLPVDSPADNRRKHARCQQALEELRARLLEGRPDVLLIFGDDQQEQFTFENLPAFCIFVGERISGYRISKFFGLPVGAERAVRPKSAEHWVTLEGHPELARFLATGLMARHFDVAFSMGASGDGIGHAFTRPLESLAPAPSVAVIPFYINCYYGPQPSAARCYELGRAIRDIVESWPAPLRVGVIGSGGLWHTPMSTAASIDQRFDRQILDALERGDARRMAEVFDSLEPDIDLADASQVERFSGGTGMVFGYGSGTGETRNWIAAAAVVDGTPGTVVDYVTINASPIGAGFAYWKLTD